MKKSIYPALIIFITLFLCTVARDASATQWAKTYGTYGAGLNELATSIQQTSDGGYIAAGYTKSFGAGNEDVWIMKLNADATIIWEKTYGGPNNERANSIQQTSDGGYIVGGWIHPFGVGHIDMWVLKLDSDGNVIWQKRYGGTGDDRAMSIQQTNDGGYIVGGFAYLVTSV